MKQYFLFLFVSLFLFGCGGGGGGGNNNSGGNNNPQPPAPTNTDNIKPGVTEAQNTAPWKSETTVDPNGSQIGTAKSRIDGLTQDILVSVASSGKKNRTDIIEETYPGPIRGYMEYKNTYTFDDVVVGDAYSYTNDTKVSFVGYEDIGYGINGSAVFNVSFSQTSLGNSTSTYVGNCSISYKDSTGVFAFYMNYNDTSTIVDGVETYVSSYTVDGETYSSTTIIQVNGDYTYETTYILDGITYTSLTTTIGSETTYLTTHLENGEVVVDYSSSSTSSYSVVDGVDTYVYTYTYEENGITYTSTSTTVDGVTSETISHIEDGLVIIDSEGTSSFTSTTVDGVTTDIYVYTYVENGFTYTGITTTVGNTTSYVLTHEENGETIVDSSSTSSYEIVDGIETSIYVEIYTEDGITYTYSSTTTGDTTTYVTSHIENGNVVIDSSSNSSSSTSNGVTTYVYTESYIYEGITYNSTSTTIGDETTVVTTWVENGVEYTDTYTY